MNELLERPNCVICGKGAQNTGGKRKNGSIIWRKFTKKKAKALKLIGEADNWACGKCHFTDIANNNGYDNLNEYQSDLLAERAKTAGFDNVADYLNSMHEYRWARKDYCENVDGRLGFRCTTTIKVKKQLQVDHIDGNPKNNNEYNLQTLCADCHIIKGIENGDDKSLGRKALKGMSYEESLDAIEAAALAECS